MIACLWFAGWWTLPFWIGVLLILWGIFALLVVAAFGNPT